jgi:hypothetical protein
LAYVFGPLTLSLIDLNLEVTVEDQLLFFSYFSNMGWLQIGRCHHIYSVDVDHKNDQKTSSQHVEDVERIRISDLSLKEPRKYPFMPLHVADIHLPFIDPEEVERRNSTGKNNRLCT